MAKDNFLKQTSKFFKRAIDNNEIKFTDNSIRVLNNKESQEEQNERQKIQVFNNLFQSKSWSGKHLELLEEYRRMDNSFPIISAALKIYAQEACLTGDMQVNTPMGVKRIDELYKSELKDFYVTVVDYKHDRLQYGMCSKVISKGFQKVYKVELLSHGVESFFKCTIDHLIKRSNGVFNQLKDLKIGDSLATVVYEKDPNCSCLIPTTNSTQIVNITELGEELVYDLVDVIPDNHFLIKTCEDNYVTVHNCSKDNDGNIFKIISNNEKIKDELEDMFYKNLRMNTMSYRIVKSFLKFGNHYSYPQTRKGYGIVDLIHFPAESMKIELTRQNLFDLGNFNYHGQGVLGGITFEPQEVVHWKFMDDFETEPYGQSILRSVVDTYRRIVMMRDALIIYRITRAPQRLLFKIDSGNIDSDAAELQADEIKKQLYKKPLVNPQTGEIDYKYSPASIQENIYMSTSEGDTSDVRVLEGACLKGDTPLRTSLGVLTIRELSERLESDTKKVYSLSINKHNKEIIGKIIWCKVTNNVNELYNIKYNGIDGKTYVTEATANHPFMIKDLSYVRADELVVGQELKGVNDITYLIESIEIAKYEMGVDVYDLEVEEYHNFALESGIFVHNSNLDQVEDYKIIKDDLFAGLMIPRQYLQFEEVQTAKAALVQEDIRFANLIKQIQEFYIEGLIHLALVHLQQKGYSVEEMQDFSIEMNTNSTFAERTRKELLEQRFAIASMAWEANNEGLNFMSYTQVLKDILKFSDTQIQKIIEDQFIEKKLAWRLINLSQNGMFEETKKDIEEREMEEKEKLSVFNNIKFESVNSIKENDSIKGLLTKQLDEEIKQLLKPVKASPSKRQILLLNENFEFNNKVKEEVNKIKKDLKG